MKLQNEDGVTAATGEPSAVIVAEYLRAHPDFFTVYPDVLRDIEITHVTGDAVSLVERQISALRDENERMKTRFDDLVAFASTNEQLIKRIHRLALALMQAAGPQAIFATLGDRLAQEFHADNVRTLIFASPSFVESAEVPEFVGGDCPERASFAAVLKSGLPHCGTLTESQIRSLFGRETQSGSAVVLPLSGKDWDGVLVISSHDNARFDENMGTEFLANLGDIVALIVDPWVARSHNG